MRRSMTVVLLLLAGSLAGIPLGFVLAQTAPQVRVRVVLQHHATDIPTPANLDVRDDRWDPGAETGLHSHPGPAILAVIEGELLEETPGGTNVLRAGQAFWRPARSHHNVKNTSGKPARVLAIHFDPVQ